MALLSPTLTLLVKGLAQAGVLKDPPQAGATAEFGHETRHLRGTAYIAFEVSGGGSGHPELSQLPSRVHHATANLAA